MSLSARRAWIEILIVTVALDGKLLVALRKESVDRNARKIRPVAPDISSLSARRAWIEILGWLRVLEVTRVALRKESVDRNRRDRCTGG